MRLRSVPGEITRPITDRVKEALFNILGPDVKDSTLLDLFGGTGSVGIEALSRGAIHVRFIDRHKLAVKTIRENLAITKLEERASVFQLDAFEVISKKADCSFDYIFIAPPQYKQLWIQALTLLDENIGWLADNGWVIVQIDPLEFQQMDLKRLKEFDRRKYGSTLLIFYSQGES